MLVFHGADATVARTVQEYERLAEVLLCTSMHTSYKEGGGGSSKNSSSKNSSSSPPSCRTSAPQLAAAHRLLQHLDAQRHTGTLFNTQAWVTCAEVAMRMAVDLRAFAPQRLHHAVVARRACVAAA